MLFPSACLWDYGSSYLLPSIRGCFCGLLRNKIHSEISFVFFGPQHGFGNGYISSFGLTIIGVGGGRLFLYFVFPWSTAVFWGSTIHFTSKLFLSLTSPIQLFIPRPNPTHPATQHRHILCILGFVMHISMVKKTLLIVIKYLQ